MGSALHHTSKNKIDRLKMSFDQFYFQLLVKGVVDSYWTTKLEVETSLTKYGRVFQYVTVRR